MAYLVFIIFRKKRIHNPHYYKGNIMTYTKTPTQLENDGLIATRIIAAKKAKFEAEFSAGSTFNYSNINAIAVSNIEEGSYAEFYSMDVDTSEEFMLDRMDCSYFLGWGLGVNSIEEVEFMKGTEGLDGGTRNRLFQSLQAGEKLLPKSQEFSWAYGSLVLSTMDSPHYEWERESEMNLKYPSRVFSEIQTKRVIVIVNESSVWMTGEQEKFTFSV